VFWTNLFRIDELIKFILVYLNIVLAYLSYIFNVLLLLTFGVHFGCFSLRFFIFLMKIFISIGLECIGTLMKGRSLNSNGFLTDSFNSRLIINGITNYFTTLNITNLWLYVLYIMIRRILFIGLIDYLWGGLLIWRRIRWEVRSLSLKLIQLFH